MPHRLYDWKCVVCGDTTESMHFIPTGHRPVQARALWCDTCAVSTLHERMFPLPAKYLADRPLSPVVHGGRFDTAGNRVTPKLPPPLPEHATWGDYKDRWNSKEYLETKRERAAIRAENRRKQERLKAIKKDPTIDVRHYPCPGDPKVA